MALTILPLTSACTEDEGMTDDADSSSQRITFTIGDENHWTETTRTRGTQATTASLSAGFGVSAAVYPAAGTYASYGCGSYFHNVRALPATATKYFWPTGDYRMAFYAYYPYGNSALTLQSAANATGVPTYAYTVPQTVASQLDVMTAQVTDRSCVSPSAVALSFAHRCADIRFTVTNEQTSTLRVKNISVYGVKYSGTLTGSSWTLTGSANSSSSHPFTLTSNTDIAASATADITGTANHFIMLPQTVGAATDIFVITTIENSEEKTYTYTLPSAMTWQAGKSYTYAITISGNSITVSGVTIVDWSLMANTSIIAKAWKNT